MTKPFQFLTIAWRIWRAHGTIVFIRVCWHYTKAFLTGEWEPWLWDCVPDQGRIAVDGGANTGQWSIKLAQRFQQVIAIEPHPSTALRLRAKVPFNVMVVEGAVWNCPIFKTLTLYPDLRICRITSHDLLYSMGPGRNGVKVVCFPLDALKLTEVDFIKLDVEGAEAEALEGAVNTIRTSSPTLLIELHSYQAQEKIEAELSTLGYAWEYKHFPPYHPRDPLYNRRLWLVARKETKIGLT